MSKQAVPTRLIDNERVRVTEWRFPVGAATGHHRHEYDYVVVPIATGKLKLVEKDGERLFDLVHGKPYFRGEGVEHDVMNASDHEVAFIEVEIK
jgi:quercetin dioxygenase-like cupin family protein